MLATITKTRNNAQDHLNNAPGKKAWRIAPPPEILESLSNLHHDQHVALKEGNYM